MWNLTDSRLRHITYERQAAGVWPLSERWFALAARFTSERWWSRWAMLPILLLLVAPRLPELLYMASAALRYRWRPGSVPPVDHLIVTVHDDRGPGWGSASWSRDKGWVSASDRQPVRVYAWRCIEGSRAELWHEDCPIEMSKR